MRKRRKHNRHIKHLKKRRNNINFEPFKYILKWIIILVIVSLIASFLISPGSFTSFKENIKSILPGPNFQLNSIRLVPSQMGEYGVYASIYSSCAAVEAMGEQQGISGVRSKICREACGKKGLEYSSNRCEVDLFVCYCS